MCVCVVLCVHVCVPCAGKCGAQRAICITFILNFYNQGLSLNPHFTDLTRLSGQQAPGISSYFLPNPPSQEQGLHMQATS